MNNREAFRNYLKTGARIGESMEKTFKAGFLSGLASQQDHIPDVGKMVAAVNALAAQTGESPESITEWLTDKGGLTQLMLSHFGGIAAQAQNNTLNDFQEGQWWLKELDALVLNGTDDQKRAVAVVRNLMRSAQAQQEPKLPEFYAEYEYKYPDWDVLISVYQRRKDSIPLLVHQELLNAQQESQWISVEEELPAYGQIVDLSINGVLQNETYEIDATDNDLYLTHFWTRDGLDDGLDIEQGQFWRARLPMPKPLPPAPEVCSDGGKCGAGGYCITCPNIPVPDGE